MRKFTPWYSLSCYGLHAVESINSTLDFRCNIQNTFTQIFNNDYSYIKCYVAPFQIKSLYSRTQLSHFTNLSLDALPVAERCNIFVLPAYVLAIVHLIELQKVIVLRCFFFWYTLLFYIYYYYCYCRHHYDY